MRGGDVTTLPQQLEADDNHPDSPGEGMGSRSGESAGDQRDTIGAPAFEKRMVALHAAIKAGESSAVSAREAKRVELCGL